MQRRARAARGMSGAHVFDGHAHGEHGLHRGGLLHALDNEAALARAHRARRRRRGLALADAPYGALRADVERLCELLQRAYLRDPAALQCGGAGGQQLLRLRLPPRAGEKRSTQQQPNGYMVRATDAG